MLLLFLSWRTIHFKCNYERIMKMLRAWFYENEIPSFYQRNINSANVYYCYFVIIFFQCNNHNYHPFHFACHLKILLAFFTLQHYYIYIYFYLNGIIVGAAIRNKFLCKYLVDIWRYPFCFIIWQSLMVVILLLSTSIVM